MDIISNQLSTNYVFLLINKISILKKIQHLLLHSSTKKTALHEAKWLPCYLLTVLVLCGTLHGKSFRESFHRVLVFAEFFQGFSWCASLMLVGDFCSFSASSGKSFRFLSS